MHRKLGKTIESNWKKTDSLAIEKYDNLLKELHNLSKEEAAKLLQALGRRVFLNLKNYHNTMSSNIIEGKIWEYEGGLKKEKIKQKEEQEHRKLSFDERKKIKVTLSKSEKEKIQKENKWIVDSTHQAYKNFYDYLHLMIEYDIDSQYDKQKAINYWYDMFFLCYQQKDYPTATRILQVLEKSKNANILSPTQQETLEKERLKANPVKQIAFYHDNNHEALIPEYAYYLTYFDKIKNTQNEQQDNIKFPKERSITPKQVEETKIEYEKLSERFEAAITDLNELRKNHKKQVSHPMADVVVSARRFFSENELTEIDKLAILAHANNLAEVAQTKADWEKILQQAELCQDGRRKLKPENNTINIMLDTLRELFKNKSNSATGFDLLTLNNLLNKLMDYLNEEKKSSKITTFSEMIKLLIKQIESFCARLYPDAAKEIKTTKKHKKDQVKSAEKKSGSSLGFTSAKANNDKPEIYQQTMFQRPKVTLLVEEKKKNSTKSKSSRQILKEMTKLDTESTQQDRGGSRIRKSRQ